MRKFWKMHGAGNDFVLLDCREHPFTGDRGRVCDRHFGIGCDQLIEVHSIATHSEDTFRLKFYNQDGSAAGACGNGTRCAASWLMERTDAHALKVYIADRALSVWQENAQVWVNMGSAQFAAVDVPLRNPSAMPLQKLLALSDVNLAAINACSMGNPHLVLFGDGVLNNDFVMQQGERLEHHSAFPERANIGFAEVSTNGIALRVWERGVGETLACGSGACAAFAIARKNNLLLQDEAAVFLPGGVLHLRQHNNDILMTGPVAMVAEGVFDD